MTITNNNDIKIYSLFCCQFHFCRCGCGWMWFFHTPTHIHIHTVESKLLVRQLFLLNMQSANTFPFFMIIRLIITIIILQLLVSLLFYVVIARYCRKWSHRPWCGRVAQICTVTFSVVRCASEWNDVIEKAVSNNFIHSFRFYKCTHARAHSLPNTSHARMKAVSTMNGNYSLSQGDFNAQTYEHKIFVHLAYY